MGGLAGRLRRDPNLAAVPIIVASDVHDFKGQAHSLGVIDCLLRPEDTVFSGVLIGGMLLPLAIGIIEINHRRSKDVILIRVEADSLEGADLSGALLLGGDLTGMRCTGASFRNARLMRACLIEADLAAADFRGADLRGATLIGADLTGARYDGNTRWPAQFDPKQSGAIEVEPSRE